MDQHRAFQETIELAIEKNMPELPGTDVGLLHLRDMARTIEESNFSESKLGRWLGWAQCAVVVSGVATLDDMKRINLKYAD